MITVRKPAGMVNATTVAHRNATRIWVQAPSGSWVQLHGDWHSEGSAVQFALLAGFTLLPAWQVIAEIERSPPTSAGT